MQVRGEENVQGRSRTWLVTGVAGFIGSNILQSLLRAGQRVVGLDNFSTGKRENLDEVLAGLPAEASRRFELHESDVRDLESCRRACRGAEVVLHEAALGSVPRSIEDPLATHASNVTGFLNMLVAARDAGVGRFVYAASSAAYGDSPALPKVEDDLGRPLSPYGAGKRMGELYAEAFAACYGMRAIGLRYFNVFGPRQDPNGAYAAVIPCWIAAMLRGEPARIHGDGETSRDFCYVDNVIQANFLAATAEVHGAPVCNVAVGERTTLNLLAALLREGLAARVPGLRCPPPVHGPPRAGDVRHSHADISRARTLLGYEPEVDVARGIDLTLDWYVRRLAPPGALPLPRAAAA